MLLQDVYVGRTCDRNRGLAINFELWSHSRFGGDEFVVLLEDLGTERKTAAETAIGIAEKLRAAPNVPYSLQVAPIKDWYCTPSIGVALFLGHDGDIDAVLARADHALYAAREGGRNRVRLGAA